MPSEKMTNQDAAATRDRRTALETALDTLAEALDLAAQRGDGTVAQLVSQYRATLSDLAGLDSQRAEVSPLDRIVDELAPRRKAGNGPPANHPRTSRRRKPSAG